MRIVFLLALASAVSLVAQEPTHSFRVSEKYFEDQLGSRLVVRPDVREDSRAADLELRITDETFFDPAQSAFVLREVATIQGGGLGSPGLIFHTGNGRSREEMIQVLEEFQSKAETFRRNQGQIGDMAEDWMGNPDQTLSQSRKIATVETDFLRRPSEVTLNWSARENRLWLSLDDFINIDSRIASPLLELVRRIPVYSRQRAAYAAEVAERNREIDKTLALPDPLEEPPVNAPKPAAPNP